MHGASHAVPAPRPALEVAHVLRAGFDDYRRGHPLSKQQFRAARAMIDCRTAALGGFSSRCGECGATTIQYASCRNRHCPKCQSLAQTRWVEGQCARLLDIGYWHVVFTLPHDLNPVAARNPGLVCKLLFRAASRTLLEFGRNPRWLGGEIGFTMVLHTWGQNLGRHIHVHAIVTGGALDPGRQRWIRAGPGFLFPTRALSRVFRGKYLDLLDAARQDGELRLPGHPDGDDTAALQCLRTLLRSRDWVVYAKPPFNGPAQVMAYLGRYTHKTAIANHRLAGFDGERVRFRWRDYARGNRRRIMTLDTGEFIRRLLLHVLPPGFTRIRHYGLNANRDRNRKLARCRELIGQPEPEHREPESPRDLMLRLTGIDITLCRNCGLGTLQRMRVFRTVETAGTARSPPIRSP